MKNHTDFDRLIQEHSFDLPEHLIARHPRPRTDSRLLVLDRKTGSLEDALFSDLPGLLKEDDLLLFNESRVSPRRVFLERTTGARVECLFLERRGPAWLVLIRGLNRLRPGEELKHGPSGHCFRFTGRQDTGGLLHTDPVDMEAFFEHHGELALPPYLGRRASREDQERYQTIFARRASSVAAPTAGLHFTADLLTTLQKRGISLAFLELEIGYGTFAPLQIEQFEAKRLHMENYHISTDLLHSLRSERRRIAVGTTTLRALESYVRSGHAGPGRYSTGLFLYPPDQVKSVEGLITNFHLPGSSLILLVAAFAGTQFIKEAYAHAIEHEYRFYSYGDVMLIL